MSIGWVRAENRTRQAKLRLIGEFDRVINAADAIHDRDGSKELFVERTHVRSDTGEQCRGQVGTYVPDSMPTGDEVRTFRDRVVDLLDEFMHRTNRRQRAQVGAGVKRVTGDICFQRGGESFNKSVVNRIKHNEPLCRGARLSGIAHPP